jgi:uncharacterized protein
MLLLLNSAKTMNPAALVPLRLKTTVPCELKRASLLAEKITNMSRSRVAELMSLSEKLTDETVTNAALWGKEGRPRIPALFGFTGLVFKSIDPAGFNADQRRYAQKNIRILSGLYGVLRPFDVIEAYRLEMGHRLMVDKAKNLAVFWKKQLTDALNDALKSGEPIVNVAAQEYMKAVDITKLKGPVISPVFKEQHPGGKLKSVVVHSKRARGELVRYAVVNRTKTPRDLMGFNAHGWAATSAPPESGAWLFTRSRVEG